MNSILKKMRQIRAKQNSFKNYLRMHELYAAKLRANITSAWDDISKDDVVTSNARLLDSTRLDIRVCQGELRKLKCQLKMYNAEYDISRKKHLKIA